LAGETSRRDSSGEDSTDSEDELNSPKQVTQARNAEKMDIDGKYISHIFKAIVCRRPLYLISVIVEMCT